MDSFLDNLQEAIFTMDLKKIHTDGDVVLLNNGEVSLLTCTQDS